MERLKSLKSLVLNSSHSVLLSSTLCTLYTSFGSLLLIPPCPAATKLDIALTHKVDSNICIFSSSKSTISEYVSNSYIAFTIASSSSYT